MKADTPPPTDRQAYYAEARSWSDDRERRASASRRTAWVIAGAAVSIAALEAVALAMLAPLKTVVPYTITVDRHTGYIETARGLKPGPLSEEGAVTQAFLAQYVLARETFDAADIQDNYREVAAWTVGPARDVYIRSMQRSNPQSPVAANPSGTVVAITIKSVSPLTAESALVRFDAERQVNGAGAERRPYAAVIGYQYSGQPMRAEDRFRNPLGFQVTSYRRDAETAEAVRDAAAATP
jgi:type IV secretion system protein VirB8